ncbi:MAG: Fe-S cluster assembly sulfur transfer protein SufU [Longimicrobiales bacterium]
MTIDRSTPALGSLFQEIILEHYKRPRNRGAIADADATVHMKNPTCGDEIHLGLRLDDEHRIAEVKFLGEGCSISQASASMMTGLLIGKTPSDVRHLSERFTAMMRGDADAAKDRALGDMRALAGVARFPVRVKCALLGWDAVGEGLKKAAEG